MNDDEQIHAEILDTLRDYFVEYQTWKTKHTDKAAKRSYLLLMKLIKLSTVQRKLIKQWMKDDTVLKYKDGQTTLAKRNPKYYKRTKKHNK